VIRSLYYSYIHRRERKRDFRKLWIVRINAAVREFGLNYSKFIYGLKKLNVNLNRKALSEMAINEPEAFKKLVEDVKLALNV
jgi:large subunit ribosomal protein L20